MSCSSVSVLLCDVMISVNLMFSLMYMTSPPPCLCALSFLIGVYVGICGVLCVC